MPQLGGPERLQPAARPVDTFVQPRAPVQDAMRALSQFAPKLQEMAEGWNQEEIAKQEASAMGKIGGMTFEESKAAVKDGSLHEFQSPWFRAAFEKQHGQRAAAEVVRRAETDLATQDLSQVNPEELAAKYMQEATAELPQSKFAQAGFAQGTSGLLDRLRSRVNDDRIARTVETRADNYTQVTLSKVEWMQGELADKDAIKVNLRAHMQQTRDMLGLSYREQDKLLADIVKTISARPGFESAVEAIGEMDRDGVTIASKMGPAFEAAKLNAKTATEGKVRDDLQPWIADMTLAADKGELDEAAFSERADAHMDVLGGPFKATMLIRNQNAKDAALAHAVAAAQAGAKETLVGNLTPSLVDLARQGRMAEVQDITQVVAGKSISLTQKDLKEVGLKAAADQIARDGQAQGRNPADIRGEQIEMYGLNGEIDPLTESRVSALLNSSVAGGDLSATVLAYLPELRVADAAAPHMIDRIASNEADRKFLDTIFVAMDTGLDAAEAVKQATWRRDNADKIVLPRGKALSTVTDAVYKKLGDEFAHSLLDPIVRDRVDYYAATGATGNDLAKRVASSIERSHAYLNGHYVDVTGTGYPASRTLPVFQEASDVLQAARPGVTGSITWMPLRPGSDRFKAVTGAGVPIPGTERTWAELQSNYSKRRTERLSNTASGMPARRAIRDSALEAAGRAAFITAP